LMAGILESNIHRGVICFVHFPVDSIRKSMFAFEDFSKRGKPLTKKLMLQGYYESRLKSSFRKF
jgi:hypothetical protein